MNTDRTEETFAGTEQERDDAGRRQPSATQKIIVGIGRAFGGALIFALPMLMTMEFWWLGFTIDRYRLALLLVLTIPLLIGLAHRVGFEETFEWREDVRDAGIAFGIGIVTGAVILALFNVINTSMPVDELVGKIALQSVPAAIGALLGRSQLGHEEDKEEDDSGGAFSGYAGELFMMAIGALFLCLNVAPTEEMILISYMMTPWHAIGLILLSIMLMHAFVYAVAFKGGSAASRDTPWLGDFMRFTIVGYVLALAISFYVLWTFGRTDDVAAMPALMAILVLAFPASIGAAAARLIL